jgi:hypothetical protein
MRYFVQHPSVVMEAFDLLWIGLAVFAAVRIASRDAFGQS